VKQFGKLFTTTVSPLAGATASIIAPFRPWGSNSPPGRVFDPHALG